MNRWISMRDFLRRVQPLITALILLSGCASMSAYPERATDPQGELTAMNRYLQPSAITKYDAQNDSERDGLSKRVWRNEVVNARVRATDLYFNAFQQKLFQEGVGLGIATDWMVLALNVGGSVAGGAASALSAASAGVVGAKAAFDKNVFFDKTMPALLANMMAKRKEVLVRIREGLIKDVDEYPLTLALNDLETYYNAGTIPGALVDIAETAGAVAKEADKKLTVLLSKERTKEFPSPERQARVKQLLERIDKLSDSKALDLEKAPPVVRDQEIEKAVALRDPTNQRSIRGAVAREMLKMRAVLSERSDADLAAWEAAVKAAEQ